MTDMEAAKLLELICIAYPYAYRDFDARHRQATVRMWASSFSQVPYCFIEECFNRYRMENRYAPTVADINLELRALRREAQTAMDIHRQLGNRDMEQHFRRIVDSTLPAALPGYTETPRNPMDSGGDIQRSCTSGFF